MKKLRILLLFLFCLFPLQVQALNLHLKELKVKNGELSLPFDSLNNKYTVIIPKDVYDLEFEYTSLEEDVQVTILDNHDLENNSIVTLLLEKEGTNSTYQFQILKEEEEITSVFREEQKETDHNVMYEYKIFVIPIVCLILIHRVYKILFKRHKKKNI